MATRKPTAREKKIYDAITAGKKGYGVYHKSCFHLHTPASHDYKFLKSWTEKDYKAASEETIYRECIDKKVLPSNFDLGMINMSDFPAFSSKKEFLSFLALADSLMVRGLEIVVVADHNTIEGVAKLETAIKIQHKHKAQYPFPTVLLGVEISCADKNHVVGIFANTEKNRQRINEWLANYLIDVENGVYLTSSDTLSFIHECDSIGYLAHLNSSNILTKDVFSYAFKKHLFDDNSIQYIGVSEPEKIETIRKKVMNYRNTPIKFVFDNDAHDVESVEDNCFWIKGGKCDFDMVKEALNDYHISVEFSLPPHGQKFIRGIYIEKRNTGFLQGKNGDGFVLTFSNALNCLIGGRGTGKSSVLEMIEYALCQRCRNEYTLDFICRHGNIWVNYIYNGEEFLVEMALPRKRDADDNILRGFAQNVRDRYQYRYRFDARRIEEYAAKNHLSVYKVVHDEKAWVLEKMASPKQIVGQFLDSRYSINELVNTAGGDEINKFLYDTIFQNRVLSNPGDVVTFQRRSGLTRMLRDTENALKQRKQEVMAVIEPYNTQQENQLRIVYQQNTACVEPDFEGLLNIEAGKERSWYNGYNIRMEDVADYLSCLYEKLGAFSFFKVAVTGDIQEAEQKVKLTEFCSGMTKSMIEKEIKRIEQQDEPIILKSIFDKVTSEANIKEIRDFFKLYISKTEMFTLEFNTNNREGGDKKVLYKPVRDLSLGQKVVAMLSFILSYSEYSGDYRPLLIDQPEDNLDNQYIYRNLVKQLREIKNKRQVIIATHNATIVTNAKADLVCVMQSDNEHGWVEATGYPSEQKIKRKILNHLEGGKESFSHKIATYRNVMN